MTALKDLEKRLEEATGGHDDDAIAGRKAIEAWIHDNLTPEPKVVQPPRYCSSLDAAVSLAERVMATEWPSWERHHRAIYSNPRKAFLVEITVPSREFRAGHGVEAIALCLATVRALIAKGGAGE